MKKQLSCLLIVAMLLSLAACGAAPDGEAELAECIRSTGAYLLKETPEPTFGSVGGDWLMLGLARSGLEMPEEYVETYFRNVSDYVARNGGVLHEKKYTEYSRVILALTAIGKDPADVAGHNLLVPLADLEQTVFQGVNGAVYALLALDSGKYEIPANTADSTQATREGYVEYILNGELSGGGWAMTGSEGEPDLTAMALQALVKYRDRAEVSEAIERGLAFLSETQNGEGGFTSYNAQSSEAVSQAIIALAELGIDLEDSRFVKNGNTLMDALLRFRQTDGSFAHLLGGKTDRLATTQAFCALAAAKRLEEGEAPLYHINIE